LAIEVAQQLVAHGRLVPFVGMIDATPGPASLSMAERIQNLARRVGPWARNFFPWALRVTTREIAEARHWVNFRKIVLKTIRGQHQWHAYDWYQNLPEGRQLMVRQNLVLSRKHRFEGIDSGAIFLFRRSPSAVAFERLFRPDDLDDYGWRGVLGANVHVVHIPGGHGTCLSAPNVTSLANQLNLALESALAAT
jgi:thioesterase domain-containing protein